MDKLIVHGGSKLTGSINISGSKNASLPHPRRFLADRSAGDHRARPRCFRYQLHASNPQRPGLRGRAFTAALSKSRAANIISEAPYEIVRKMRASICVMGPLIARLGRASVSMPGGCVIGDRPIDLHLKGLKAIGAQIDTEGGNMIIEAEERP